jgi:Na+/H+ antiporter NhaD/arsenite permease-like protein
MIEFVALMFVPSLVILVATLIGATWLYSRFPTGGFEGTTVTEMDPSLRAMTGGMIDVTPRR